MRKMIYIMRNRVSASESAIFTKYVAAYKEFFLRSTKMQTDI